MQDMLTRTIRDKRKENLKSTNCKNCLTNKKKQTQVNKKKKTRINISSPTTQITYNSCGHKIVRKVTVSEEVKPQRKKPKKKIMTDKFTSCVQCPSFEMNPLKSRNEERDTLKSKDPNTLSQQSICVREIKKRKDLSRFGTLNTRSTECSSCCRNSENFHYAVKDNYNSSRNINSYLNHFNKSNLNYNDYSYKTLSDQHKYRTRYVECPNSLKPTDKFLSTDEEKNSNNHLKNFNYDTIDRTVCCNKNMELSQQGEPAEQDANLNKCCVKNRDNLVKPNEELFFTSNENKNCLASDDQRVVKFFPRVDTKYENGIFEAYSQFKISIQCYDKGQNKQTLNKPTNQETQTALEIRQQGISTDVATYSSKETQCEGATTQSRQTGIDDEDLNTVNIPKTVCVSCDQTDETKDELNDYFLLMPGGKCVKLAQKIFANENYVPCPGANDSPYDDECLSICTATSITTQESKLVDSNTMTTPEILECVEKILTTNGHSEEILDSQGPSRTRNNEISDKENQCSACKSYQVVDEDFKFCFEKLFNKKLSDSDCFPCLKEKLDKTGDLTKKFLYILKYALELGSKTENNTNGGRLKYKNTKEIIKKLCKCVKKLSDVEMIEKRSKNLTNKLSKSISTVKESATYDKLNEISKNNVRTISSVNSASKNIGIEKETETDERPITSRSTNTFVEEIPVENFESEGTNTDFSIPLKETGTNTIEKRMFQDASTQSRFIEKCNDKTKMTTNQCREPILVRVISSNDRQRAKTQSSEYSTSESDDFRRNGFRRVCFNDKTQFQLLKRDLKKCEENCISSNKESTKIRAGDKSDFRAKKKLMDKKCTETPRIRNGENRKIFYNDFFD